MKRSEVEKIETKDGIFTESFTYDDEIPVKDEAGNTIDYELTNYRQVMTAEENYNKWLEDRDNKVEKVKLSEEERIKNLEGAVEDLANIISEIAAGGIQ